MLNPICVLSDWNEEKRRKAMCTPETQRLPEYDDFGRKCCFTAVCKAAHQNPPTDDLQ